MLLFVVRVAREVRATHGPDHRYTVTGYVMHADGMPLTNISVVVRDQQGTRLGTTRTGARGQYSILLHLHTPDRGRVFTVEAHKVSRQIRVTCDPDDTISPRVHRLDILSQ